MQEKITSLITRVVENANREDFEYHEWFVNYHLKIVEEIALSLAEEYPQADKDLVRVLAWIHDYSKPITHSKEEEKNELLPMTRRILAELSFDEAFITRICTLLEEIESKDTRLINNASIEAKIVSSADGAAHFFGPFFFSYFRNDPNEPLTITMDRVLQKATRDWEKKIVLPEARDLVRSRYENLISDMSARM